MPNTQQYEAYDAKTGQYWDWDGKSWTPRKQSTWGMGGKVDIGLQKGAARSIGLNGDPTTYTINDIISRLVGGTIESGKESLKAWGPLAPADMIAKGIEGIASTAEQGGRTAYKGIRSKDPETTATGAMEILSSLAQMLTPAEKGEKVGVLREVPARPGRVTIAGREYPALKSEMKAEPGVRGNLEQGMKRSFVGSPLQKVGKAQQSFARTLVSDIAANKAGIPSDPDAFVNTVSNAAETMRRNAVSQYDGIVKELSGGSVPSAEEIAPARETAKSVEEAQRNVQNANRAAIKAFGKPFGSISEDEKASVLNLLGIEDKDLAGPSQHASSMRGTPASGKGAGAAFSSLMRERHELSEDARAAYHANPPDFTRYRDLQNQIRTIEGRMDDLVSKQGRPDLIDKYNQAKALTKQSYAMRDFGDVMDSVTKGLNKMQQEGAGFKYRPQEIQAPQMVEKIKDLGGRLDQAVGPQDAQAIRQTAEMLRRAQAREGTGGFAHYATTYGPALYAIEELFRRGSPGGFAEAGAIYGGLYLVSKVLASRAGRTAMLNYVRSAKGSPEAALWQSRIMAVARGTLVASSAKKRSSHETREP